MGRLDGLSRVLPGHTWTVRRSTYIRGFTGFDDYDLHHLRPLNLRCAILVTPGASRLQGIESVPLDRRDTDRATGKLFRRTVRTETAIDNRN